MYTLWAETQTALFAAILLTVDELQDVCLTLDPDIICITETWLSSNVEDQEIVLSGY